MGKLPSRSLPAASLQTQRLEYHNAGTCPHTSKSMPWKVETYAAFSDKAKAIAFAGNYPDQLQTFFGYRNWGWLDVFVEDSKI